MSSDKSTSDLLEMLRTCKERHGECTVSVFEADEDFCAPSTIIDRFGTWEEARHRAGLTESDTNSTSRRGNQQYTNEEMLEMLRECKQRHGDCAPRTFNTDEDFCSVSAVMRRFGSWKEAKEQAGIDEDLSGKSGRKQQFSDEQILSHLTELQHRHGKCTTELLRQEEDLIAPSVVIERFGSWKEAKRRAGLQPDERASNSRPQEYSNEEYLELLRECEEKYGKVTQRVFDSDEDFPSSGAVRKRFGSWSEAKEQAGLDTGRISKYTKDELLEMLRTCQERHGTCTAHVFASDDDFCSPETVQRAFGSWTDAKHAVNSETNQGTSGSDRDVENTE